MGVVGYSVYQLSITSLNSLKVAREWALSVVIFSEVPSARLADRPSIHGSARANDCTSFDRASGTNSLACRPKVQTRHPVRIHREILKERRMTGLHFWAKGYWVSTVGADEERVRNYIREQDKLAERQGDLDLK